MDAEARRSRVAAGVLILVLSALGALGALALTGHLPWPPGAPWAQHPPSSAPGVPERPADAFALTVDRVVDGDTIRATAQAPNAVLAQGVEERIRLIGIDTPELAPPGECGAAEARDHARALLPEGATVWAAPDTESRDRYDRALLYLWTEAGVFVNHALLAAGDAEALRVRPNDAHAALFAAAEADARAAGAGQWGACR